MTSAAVLLAQDEAHDPQSSHKAATRGSCGPCAERASAPRRAAAAAHGRAANHAAQMRRQRAESPERPARTPSASQQGPCKFASIASVQVLRERMLCAAPA